MEGIENDDSMMMMETVSITLNAASADVELVVS